MSTSARWPFEIQSKALFFLFWLALWIIGTIVTANIYVTEKGVRTVLSKHENFHHIVHMERHLYKPSEVVVQFVHGDVTERVTYLLDTNILGRHTLTEK